MPYNLNNDNKLPSENSLQPINVNIFRSALGQKKIQLPTDVPEVNVSPMLYSYVRGYQRLFTSLSQRQKEQTQQTKEQKPIQYQKLVQPIVTPQNIPTPKNEFMPAPVKTPSVEEKLEEPKLETGTQTEQKTTEEQNQTETKNKTVEETNLNKQY